MKKRIKIQGLLIAGALLALFFFWRHLLSRHNFWLEFAGVILLCKGYLLRIIARGQKSELNPDGKTLVTQGVYALTRNPMYLGTLLIGLGIILAIFKWWVAVVFLAIYLAIYIPQIDGEEKTLSDRFGEGFKRYCQVTPKFFPAIVTILRTPPGKYLRMKPAWVKKELPSLILTLIFIIGIKIWINFRS